MIPTVAIVGRPNVGKSTLFNRIIGRRRAITLDMPGVTRDRHYGSSTWEGKDFRIIDTGGFFLDSGDKIERKVRDQVEIAVHEAQVILYVLDGRQGLLPEEKKVGQHLKRSGKPVLFVINKVDGPKQEELLADFYELGEDVHPISSEHGYRVNDLLDEVVKVLPDAGPAPKEDRRIKVALLGRPNVGKSSLLNHLLGEDRVLVHEEPGTTRDTIDTAVKVGKHEYLVMDTAGIRRHAKWSSKVERYSVLASLDAMKRADVCLLLLDSKEGIHKQDAHVAGYIYESGKGLIILWNKWDLFNDTAQNRKKFETTLDEDLRFLTYAPRHFISAKTGFGCSSLWKSVTDVHEASGKKIKTSELNRVLEGLVTSHNVPVFRGKQVKFSYATQTQSHPPTFLVFVNEPDGVHFSFQRYLINGFRKAFGLEKSPIRALFRKK